MALTFTVKMKHLGGKYMDKPISPLFALNLLCMWPMDLGYSSAYFTHTKIWFLIHLTYLYVISLSLPLRPLDTSAPLPHPLSDLGNLREAIFSVQIPYIVDESP